MANTATTNQTEKTNPSEITQETPASTAYASQLERGQATNNAANEIDKAVVELKKQTGAGTQKTESSDNPGKASGSSDKAGSVNFMNFSPLTPNESTASTFLDSGSNTPALDSADSLGPEHIMNMLSNAAQSSQEQRNSFSGAGAAVDGGVNPLQLASTGIAEFGQGLQMLTQDSNSNATAVQTDVLLAQTGLAMATLGLDLYRLDSLSGSGGAIASPLDTTTPTQDTTAPPPNTTSPPDNSSGPQFYVAPDGSDSNAGTQASPWATIQKAANSATAGSTVNIGDGTYAEDVNVANSGITFTGSKNAIVRTFDVTGNNDTISGLSIGGTPDDKAQSTGADLEGNNDQIIGANFDMQGEQIGSVTPSAVVMNGDSDLLSDSRITGVSLSNPTEQTAVIMNSGGSNDVAQGNTLTGMHDADMFRVWGTNDEIVGNDVYGNDNPSYGPNGDTSPHSDFVQWFSGGPTNLKIEDNYVHDNDISIGNMTSQGSVEIDHNVFANMGALFEGTGATVDNNVFDNPTNGGNAIYSGGGTITDNSIVGGQLVAPGSAVSASGTTSLNPSSFNLGAAVEETTGISFPS
jgi:hypothetical protein